MVDKQQTQSQQNGPSTWAIGCKVKLETTLGEVSKSARRVGTALSSEAGQRLARTARADTRAIAMHLCV